MHSIWNGSLCVSEKGNVQMKINTFRIYWVLKLVVKCYQHTFSQMHCNHFYLQSVDFSAKLNAVNVI